MRRQREILNELDEIRTITLKLHPSVDVEFLLPEICHTLHHGGPGVWKKAAP
jgi:hypothetical protein